MPRKHKQRRVSDERLTVSLAPGQRQTLDGIAEQNGVALSYVVRRAITEFLAKSNDGQMSLPFG